ncbi:peptide synthetase [Nesterenkonia sp. DZ6]|uniref:peptide synthetase n=1 Tax=Nesterenkonia sp. DZ6 TaxID=2901229 RepID=UPI001F4D06A7|nr:peptide synthetase [Nesterenkonia sp. DZ6]MCH8560873.1 peptide synthetase [Nesterenkonia sp. DZ6]
MRLTNVAQMHARPGRLSSYSVVAQLAVDDAARRTSDVGFGAGLPGAGVPAADPPGGLPVSFDQNRHVSFGSRPGSWMAVSFQLDGPASLDEIAAAWQVVIQRHGTLRTVFDWRPEHSPRRSDTHHSNTGPGGDSGGPVSDLLLREVAMLPGTWEQLSAPERPRRPISFSVDRGAALKTAHLAAPSDQLNAAEVKAALRAHFDAVCDPFGTPSHRLCVIDDGESAAVRDTAGSPQIVIGSDHAHVDAWSLLVLVRDFNAVLNNLRAGRPAAHELPVPESFAAHTMAMEAKPFPPEEIVTRWREILEAGGGVMPTFPLPLGDISLPVSEKVEVRDVLDSAELNKLEAHAREEGVRLIAVAVSVMTRIFRELGDQPLRTVFPVHSRDEPRWFDSVGWFITNAVLENEDDSLRGSYQAVKEAIRLGSHPMAPIMRPYGGMPAEPGMFAMSWLDHRRLPINVDEALNAQHVSAVVQTDGVMIWFVVNETGLHLRCRYPDTPQARETMRTWLDAVVEGLRAPSIVEG